MSEFPRDSLQHLICSLRILALPSRDHQARIRVQSESDHHHWGAAQLRYQYKEIAIAGRHFDLAGLAWAFLLPTPFFLRQQLFASLTSFRYFHDALGNEPGRHWDLVELVNLLRVVLGDQLEHLCVGARIISPIGDGVTSDIFSGFPHLKTLELDAHLLVISEAEEPRHALPFSKTIPETVRTMSLHFEVEIDPWGLMEDVVSMTSQSIRERFSRGPGHFGLPRWCLREMTVSGQFSDLSIVPWLSSIGITFHLRQDTWLSRVRSSGHEAHFRPAFARSRNDFDA